jgi:hypothetical protein
MFNLYNPKNHSYRILLAVYNIKEGLNTISTMIFLIFAIGSNNLAKCLNRHNQHGLPFPLCIITP